MYRVSRLLTSPCTDQLRDRQTVKSRLPRLTEPQRKLILQNSGVNSGIPVTLMTWTSPFSTSYSETYVESKRTIMAGGTHLTPGTDRYQLTLSGFGWPDIAAVILQGGCPMLNLIRSGRRSEQQSWFLIRLWGPETSTRKQWTLSEIRNDTMDPVLTNDRGESSGV